MAWEYKSSKKLGLWDFPSRTPAVILLTTNLRVGRSNRSGRTISFYLASSARRLHPERLLSGQCADQTNRSTPHAAGGIGASGGSRVSSSRRV